MHVERLNNILRERNLEDKLQHAEYNLQQLSLESVPQRQSVPVCSLENVCEDCPERRASGGGSEPPCGGRSAAPSGSGVVTTLADVGASQQAHSQNELYPYPYLTPNPIPHTPYPIPLPLPLPGRRAHVHALP